MTFGVNLLLAFLWASIIGPFSVANLFAGFVLGYIVLRAAAGAGSDAPATSARSSRRSG
jgi:multisubunit Na+/H+ antiporter MnhE subunit